MSGDRPRRMAEVFAGTPYRVLATNRPMDFNWSVEGFLFDGREYNIGMAEALMKEQAPIIYADDVFLTLPTNDVIEQWKFLRKMQLVPRAILPFDQMFIEANVPEALRGDERRLEEEAVEDGYDPRKYGQCLSVGAGVQYPKFDPDIEKGIKQRCINEMLLFSARCEGKSEREIAIEMLTRPPCSNEVITLNSKISNIVSGHYIKKFRDELKLETEEDYEEYVSKCRLVSITPYYFRKSQDKMMGPFGIGFYLLGPDYRIVRFGAGVAIWLLSLSESANAEDYASMSEGLALQLYANSYRIASIVIQTISLLNCSNVRLVCTGKTNEDIGRRRRDQMRLACIRHHELRVKVGEQMLRVDGRSETGQSICPLTTVRGHFRDYSEGKGLFGKYKYNCIWVPPFVRGDLSDGIVTRDYVLETADQKPS